MNILRPWNLVFLVGLIVFFGIRREFFKRTKDEEKAVSRFDRLEKILLIAIFPPTLPMPLIYLFSNLFAFADYEQI